MRYGQNKINVRSGSLNLHDENFNLNESSQMRPKYKVILVEIISGLFILLFVYASANKLLDYQKFLVQLGKSPILSPFSNWIAWLIPLMEIVIALGLYFKDFSCKRFMLLLA
jgi:hypothetical protein